MMKKKLLSATIGAALLFFQQGIAQIKLLKDYVNNTSASIGIFQNIHFKEGGFSSMYPIPETDGKEFWTISDRGVNVDATNANPAECHPTYDKIYSFAGYAPKIHRIRIAGDSITILKTITIKRPNGGNASGLLNPAGYGSTSKEEVCIDTVQDCSRLNSKIVSKDIWGIDSEGIAVDKEGNFWVCEEGGPTIWKLNPDGIVLKRFTPYTTLPLQAQDVLIDSVFKYRKNNRGFEGISITPNGKIYAIIQSPLLYPNVNAGENTRIHRILEINPVTNATRVFVYLNEGLVGIGTDQIRLRDWKIGDMAAINNHEFLVIEAGTRGKSDEKRIFKIDISNATTINAGLYGGKTLEELKDSTGLDSLNIRPVKKELFLNLLDNGWIRELDKSEGLAIINDSTIAVSNDNDYGQTCPLANGVAVPTNAKSHVFVFELKGTSKLKQYVPPPSFEPEIALMGNDVDITNGDSTASSKDNTHFGNVRIGKESIKEFVIRNNGLVSLTVNNITLIGTNASEFSLTNPLVFPKTIPSKGSLVFQVKFAPLEGGTRNAILSIINNDADEQNYNVLLEGEATFSTGVEENLISTALKIFPNPAGESVVVETAVHIQETVQLRVVDMQGREIMMPVQKVAYPGLNRFEINTEAWSDGIYFIELLSTTQLNKLKLVIMH